MKPVVFIHTNDKQLLGARVAAYALRKSSRHGDEFDVRIINSTDFPVLDRYDGRPYLREGERFVWRAGNLQSFTPLRFLPPQLMGYRGRAVVIDPDVFAVGDVHALLTREMDGKAILCRRMEKNGQVGRGYASSVMLLDCDLLGHWKWEQMIQEVFDLRRDYWLWITLQLEPEGSVGDLEAEWNHFDTLNQETQFLHNTERLTQPWKTGLEVDWRGERPKSWRFVPETVIRGVRSVLGRGGSTRVEYHRSHPDPSQERFFFALLSECLDEGWITEGFLRSEIEKRHLRPDAMEMLRVAV